MCKVNPSDINAVADYVAASIMDPDFNRTVIVLKLSEFSMAVKRELHKKLRGKGINARDIHILLQVYDVNGEDSLSSILEPHFLEPEQVGKFKNRFIIQREDRLSITSSNRLLNY